MTGATKKSPLLTLTSVGPATVADLKLLGITTVEQLVGKDPRAMYAQLCALTGVRHDPCLIDVFSAAIAQAEDPELESEKKNWWYWSRLRKGRS